MEQHELIKNYLYGELKIQEDEVTEQRFFAIDEIPPEDKLDLVNKPVIDLAMSELS